MAINKESKQVQRQATLKIRLQTSICIIYKTKVSYKADPIKYKIHLPIRSIMPIKTIKSTSHAALDNSPSIQILGYLLQAQSDNANWQGVAC